MSRPSTSSLAIALVWSAHLYGKESFNELLGEQSKDTFLYHQDLRCTYLFWILILNIVALWVEFVSFWSDQIGWLSIVITW